MRKGAKANRDGWGNAYASSKLCVAWIWYEEVLEFSVLPEETFDLLRFPTDVFLFDPTFQNQYGSFRNELPDLKERHFSCT